MVISRIGFSSAEAATITIPGTYQAGDLIIIFAFRDGSVTNPTIPSGWTSITSTTDGTNCSVSAGWKVAISGADTSGTWTNATGLVCAVYRNQATNKTPIGTFQPSAGTTNTVTYAAVSPMVCPGTSWLVAFAGHINTDTTIETAPTNLTNQTNTAGATAEYAGHDSNGIYTAGAGGWPSTNVTVSGTAGAWQTMVLEIFAEQSSLENYKFASATSVNAGIMSVTEKIK